MKIHSFFHPHSLLLCVLAGSLFVVSCEKSTVEPELKTIIRPIGPTSSPYVTTLEEYRPAPGQFLNKTIGDLASAKGILAHPDKPNSGKGMVSLGAWGGFIVLGFDHTVMNRPEKEDLVIYGNALDSFSEPGIIWVMQDENGNGKPDDTWYELAGSEFNEEGYVRNYAVTYTRPLAASDDVPWKDNQGNSGVVKTNAFHKQAYYPEWILEDEYTLTGSLLPSYRINMNNPSLIISTPFDYGYADNSQGGDYLDINNAVDKDGKSVTLTGIDFIKIQTGVQVNMGWLGELSTEIIGVADLSLLEIK